jgi:hypothetical protein
VNIQISDLQGQRLGERPIAFEVIETARGTQAVKDTVVAHLAARRQGTRSAKTVGEVAGRTRNRGARREPAAPGGLLSIPCGRAAVSFDTTARLQRQVTEGPQAGAAQVLSERMRMGDVIVLNEPGFHPLTRDFLPPRPRSGSAARCSSSWPVRTATRLASGNVPDVKITTGDDPTPTRCVGKIVITEEAFRKVEAPSSAKEVA